MIKMYTAFLLCSMCLLVGCGKKEELKSMESMTTMDQVTEYTNENALTVEQKDVFSKIEMFAEDTVRKFSERIYGEEKTKEGNGLYVKQFGIEDGKEMLTIEIRVSDLPDGVEQMQFYNIMEQFENEVYTSIRDNVDMISYLDEKEVSYLEFILDTPWEIEEDSKEMKNEMLYHLHYEEFVIPAPLLIGKNSYWKTHIQLSTDKIRGQIRRGQDFEMPSEMTVRIIYDDETVAVKTFYEHEDGRFDIVFDTWLELAEFKELTKDEQAFQNIALELEYEDQSMRIDLEKQ